MIKAFKRFAGLAIAIQLLLGLLLFVLSLIVALRTDRSLDFIVQGLGDGTGNVPYIISRIVTVFLNGAILAFNLVVELIQLFA